MTITAYPLTWPDGWKRTAPALRQHGHFGKRVKRSGSTWTSLEDLSTADAVARVLDELQRMGITRDDIVISTNLRTRLDGLPRGDQKRPDDPGASVYWEEHNGTRRCIAVDQYFKVEDNLAAIAATLDAMRAIERHGGAAILERAFTGFTALPAPSVAREWWDVLQCQSNASPEVILAQYRRLRSDHHPDKGGNPDRFAEVQRAYDRALEVR